jgi:hypothetical protein
MMSKINRIQAEALAATVTNTSVAKNPVANKTTTPAKTNAAKAPINKAVVAKPAASKPLAANPVAKAAAPKTVTKEKLAKAVKEKTPKLKMERDSFTMPKTEYAQFHVLKERLNKLGQPAKKSELLRAGIMQLTAMTDAALKAAMTKVPAIKTGRPKK